MVDLPHADRPEARKTRRIASRCTQLSVRYAPFAIDDGLFQTILAFFWRQLYVPRAVPSSTDHIQMEDGGITSLVWFDHARPWWGRPTRLPDTAPIVFFMPGTLGGWFAPYLRRLEKICPRRGWRCVVFTRRGCDGIHLTTPKPQLYTDTADVQAAVDAVHRKYPDAPMIGVGFSLGANYLVRYVGLCSEQGEPHPFLSCVTAANPFDLRALGNWGERFSRTADFAMRTDIGMMIERNRAVLQRAHDVPKLLRARSYRQLCAMFHCEAHGHEDVDAFLHTASCAHHLSAVNVPTLVANAADDPVVPPAVIPFHEFGKSDHLVLAVTRSGGHHAWMGWNPLSPSWFEALCLQWIASTLQENGFA